jgi:uncharacterized protein (DUF362 family)
MRHSRLALTRRRALATIGALVGASGSCAPRTSESLPIETPREDRRALVAVVRSSDHLAAVDAALEKTGVFDSVRRGDKAFLKVNSNSGDLYPYSTSADVVEHVAKKLADLGAEVSVGDRSFWGDPRPRENLEKNGVAPAARRGGAPVVVFDY